MDTTHQCHSQSSSEIDNNFTHTGREVPENKKAPENRELTITNRRIHIDELDKNIGRLNRSLNATSYQLLVMIREFDERGGWLRWSFADGVSLMECPG